MPTPTTIWLDESTPALPSAATWLIDDGLARSTAPGECNLQATTCVVPGRRAGRRLIVELVLECARRDVRLVPPRTMTPGGLGEHLAPHVEPVASPAETVLAWTRALHAVDASALLPHPPDADDLPAWSTLARTLARLHDEIAGAALTIERVAAEAAGLDLPAEADRWLTIEALRAACAAALDECGLVDRHAALHRAVRAGAGDPERHVVLVGIVDLNAQQRAIVARHPGRVTALVHASPDRAAMFDELGCMVEAAWTDAEIEIDEEQLIIADRFEDQAHAVIETIGGFGGRFAAEEIVVGLGDPVFADTMRRTGTWTGLRLHDPTGAALANSGPSRLLAALPPWLRRRDAASLAALLRHPDLAHHLGDAGAAIATLDALVARRLVDRLPPGPLTATLDALLAPLVHHGPRPLADHAAAVLDLLAGIYGHLDPTSPDAVVRGTVDACTAWRDLLAAHRDAHPDLQPVCDAPTALILFLDAAREVNVADATPGESVEMLGWLELHLDPAPALILTGCVDGKIPDAVTADPFLPDGLRRRLGMMHNDRRTARDACLLDSIRRSRRAFVIVTGRRDAAGDRVTPSRLLMACPTRALPARIELLTDERHVRTWRRPAGAPAPGEVGRFTVPELPAPLPEVTSMRVTQFRAYLRCPYRFALEHLLGLETVPRDPRELDAMQFGILLHDVMTDFGRDEAARDLTDADRIGAALVASLERRAAETYGAAPLPTVRVQVARLRQRLEAFAVCQARMRAEGWSIQRTEWKLPEGTRLEVDGAPMTITGRIDRIDHHPDRGWRIIDYKTSDTEKTPEKAHHGGKRPEPDAWTDVQLPLYRHLARPHLGSEPIEVGYVTLPKADRVSWRAASWSADEFDDAVETARRVVRDIRAGRFERDMDIADARDDFGRICQTAAFVPDEGESDGEGDDQAGADE